MKYYGQMHRSGYHIQFSHLMQKNKAISKFSGFHSNDIREISCKFHELLRWGTGPEVEYCGFGLFLYKMYGDILKIAAFRE